MKKRARPGATKSKAAVLGSPAGGVHMKRVNFQLPADWHMELKVYAAQQGKAITELLTEHVSN
jgi:hypothetical protein